MSVPNANIARLGAIVAAELGIKNFSLTQKDGDPVIENYFGFINPLNISGFKDEEKMSTNIILKLGQSNEGPEFKRVLREIYEIEIFFYRTLLPIFKRVSKSTKIAPECYYIEENPDPIIVLQDMRDVGYQRYERSFSEIEHVIVSLKTLAELHAMSILVIEKDIPFDNLLLRPYTPTYPMEYHDAIKYSFTKHLDSFKDSPHKEFFENLILKYDYFLYASTSQIKCSVCGHGDFWRENILFKYENNTPVSACLIDFQKTRTLSPAQDFLHLLATSVESPTRREHIEIFISSYLDTLHSRLNQNDLNISYTREDFIHDLKVVAPVITAITFMSFSLWSGLHDEAFVQSKNIANVDNILEANAKFKQKIIDVVEDLNYFGFIDTSGRLVVGTR